MKRDETLPPAPAQAPEAASDPRPAYEPPRIVKKRSVSRATLASTFGGCGVEGCIGVVASG
jgi:hypothetical protein